MSAPTDAFLQQVDVLQDEVSCAICQDLLHDTRLLACGHTFCAECVLRAIALRPRCPLCKAPATKRQLRSCTDVDIDQVALEVARLVRVAAKYAKPPPPPAPLLAHRPQHRNDTHKRFLPAPPTSNASAPTRSASDRHSQKPSRHGAPSLRAHSPPPSRKRPALPEHGELCGFCHRSLSIETLDLGTGEKIVLGPPEGPYSCGQRSVLVHRQCALWTAEVCEDDSGQLQFVERGLRRGHSLRCDICDQNSATIGCRNARCRRSFHLPCGLAAAFGGGAGPRGRTFVDLETYSLFCCRDHVTPDFMQGGHLAQILEVGTPHDSSQSVTQEHDDLCSKCMGAGKLLCCDTCHRVFHFKCHDPPLTACPLDEWSCQVCVGRPVGSKRPVTGQQPGPVPQSPKLRATTPSGQGYDGDNGDRPLARDPTPDKSDERIDASVPVEHGGPRQQEPKNKPSKAKLVRRVILGTGLNAEQKDTLEQFAKKHQATIVFNFRKDLTHVVINSVDRRSIPKRTIKYCMAVAAGCRIMCFGWIYQSLEERTWADEDQYETEFSQRMRARSDPPFAGQSFYLGEYGGEKPTPEELKKLIRLGGGVVCPRASAADFDVVNESRGAHSDRHVTPKYILDCVSEAS